MTIQSSSVTCTCGSGKSLWTCTYCKWISYYLQASTI